MDLTAFAADVGDAGPVTIAGGSTRGGPVPDVRCVHAPAGIEWIQADEMTVSCGAGTRVADLEKALAEVGQRTVLPSGGTVGGALAVGRSGLRRLGDGPMRDALLQAHYVNAGGEVVKAGGPTVKNVSGFDVCRLLVGARGTLGFLGDVILRTRPLAARSQWFVTAIDDPMALFAALHRPVSVLWDGASTWVLLEGHDADVAAQAARFDLRPADGPPPLPAHRFVVAPGEQLTVGRTIDAGAFVAELGVGTIHAHADAVPSRSLDAGVASLARRVKQQFDPAGRLNPGVCVG